MFGWQNGITYGRTGGWTEVMSERVARFWWIT